MRNKIKYILFITIFGLTSNLFSQENKLESKTEEKSTELNEVTVYGNKRQYIKVESDKTIISVKDNAMLNTGNSLDAIKRLPGVITSPTGSLTLNSKGVKVYIDGVPSSLSGTDLQNYLSSLPANAIENVELIYNPGASYEANSSGSIINIVTSTKRMKGINASFNINYNFNKYQKPSPQVLLNGKEKNLSWQTMVGYNYIDSENKTVNQQTFTYFQPNKELNQANFSVNTNRNFYFRAGSNYKVSKKSNILLNYSLNLANDRSVYESSATQIGVSDFESQGISKNKNNNNEISLQYKTKLDTLGKTLDIIAFTNTFNRNPLSQSSAFESYNNSDIAFKLGNYYLKYDFSFPFEKLKFSINTGGKYALLNVNNTGKYNFNALNSNIFASNTYASTINFDYKENNLAFYAEARKKIKKISITAGLRFEDFKVNRISSTTTDKITFNNSNLFPNLSVLYEINQNINISSSYSKKIQQPNYNSLDSNNSTNVDKYNTSQGNPYLNPSFFDNFEFKISAFQFAQFGVNYTAAKNNNQFVYSANDGQLISNQTFQQFEKIKTFSAFASFPIPLDLFFKGKEEFTKRMNTIDKMNYIFLNLNYIKTTISDYNYELPNEAIMNYNLQGQFILPWEVTSTLNYFILPKGTWEIYKIEKPIQQFDISLNRDFLNKNLKVGLHCFDVFNINEVNAIIAGKNLITNFYQKQDSRTFRISLTYNFGNLKLNQENTNINTEKVKQGGGMMK